MASKFEVEQGKKTGDGPDQTKTGKEEKPFVFPANFFEPPKSFEDRVDDLMKSIDGRTF